MRQLT